MMNFTVTFSKFQKIFLCGLMVVFSSCTSDDKDESDSGGTSESLHLSFKTPDWERHIDCDRLDLTPNAINDSTYVVHSSSESTGETFVFSYPRYSSKMLKAKTLSKHKIMDYGYNEEPFQFSQILPLDANSIKDTSKRLVSAEGLSDSEYNQVVKVEHLGSEGTYDLFKVVCKYQMQTYLVANPETIKTVTGTFAFKVRTSKD